MAKAPTSTYTLKDTDLFLDKSTKEYVLKIKDRPESDQPRQKLIDRGPGILSLQELLAVILNVGNKSEDVIHMTQRIVREYGERSIFSATDATDLSQNLNIPLVKACQVIACGEIGRRLYEKNAAGFTVVRTAKDVYEYLHDMRNLPKEHLRGLYLNSHNRIIHDEVISIGTLTTNIVHPREVFRPAIEYSAAAIVLAHNHPSGICVPSSNDIEVTKQLIEVGKTVGIRILDHIIVTKESFASIVLKY
jgi:DNA repair protein RadC